MLIGILSDSHDNLPMIQKAVEVLKRRGVDLVLHAGDYVAPFSLKPLLDSFGQFIGVFGNNDGEILGIFQKSEGRIKAPFLELEEKGYRIFVSHFYQPAKLAFA
ncbi:MAG: metallophosphoesterase family protein, partial [Desulfatiglandales bacterium]